MQRRAFDASTSFLPSQRRRKSRPGVQGAPRAVCAEPLEERVLCALCKAAGGSGYSGTLSTNPATRQQQLICDPDEPHQGSTSVSYDAALVTLAGFEAGPGYTINRSDVLVEVERIPSPDFVELTDAVVIQQFPTELVTFDTFQQGRPSFIETGYAQVKYTLTGDAGQLQPAYPVSDEAGPPGVDPFALRFDPVGPIITIQSAELFLAAAVEPAAETGPTYTVFAAQANTHSGNEEDFFVDADGNYIGPDEISPAVVTTTPVAGKPVVSVTAPVETVNGPVDVTLFATDPSDADEAAGFTFTVDWGDGSPVLTVPATANNGTLGVPLSHEYAHVGAFTITTTATDQHGEVSDPVTTQISVGGAELRPDPVEPSKLALFVYGSSGDDVIRFDKVGNGLAVSINGNTSGPFYDVNRVVAFGFAGNDDISMNAQGSYKVLFFGGAGNDTLTALNGGAVLDGGDGIDLLTAGNGSDLLIGGRGGDVMRGGNGEDILVSGRTSYDEGTDADVRALGLILDEWTRGGRYETRIDHLTGATPGGSNGASTFRVSGAGQNVFDDKDADDLGGGAGRDWLLLGSGDTSDLAKNETGSTLLA